MQTGLSVVRLENFKLGLNWAANRLGAQCNPSAKRNNDSDLQRFPISIPTSISVFGQHMNDATMRGLLTAEKVGGAKNDW